MSDMNKISRRNFLVGTAATALGGGSVLLSGVKNAYAGTFDVNMQLGWLLSNGQIGEIVAAELGYFKEENVSLKIALAKTIFYLKELKNAQFVSMELVGIKNSDGGNHNYQRGHQ